jgi:tryptophanyl-tRNA synthetase
MDDEEIDRLVMSMITDPQRVRRDIPGRPEVCNVFSWHRLFEASEDELAEVYRGCTTAVLGCVEDKRNLAARVRATVAPIRERREALLADPDRIDAILDEGAERARAIAAPVLAEVRAAMGL